jgi:hypothetical protein
MSNGMTSVFIETCCLAGAEIAEEDYQKDLMIWFGQRDWVILGMGVEGFDIAEINWNNVDFDNQKKFILRVLESVSEKLNWGYLSYEPNTTFLFEKLDEFKAMIIAFTKEHVKDDDSERVGVFEFEGAIEKYDRCDKHKIYKHWQGCVICNNEG